MLDLNIGLILEKRQIKNDEKLLYESLYIVRKLNQNKNNYVKFNSDLSTHKKTIQIKNDNYCLTQLKPDKMPVGIYLGKKNFFVNQEVILQPNDAIYMFSDGYYDQFGGDSGRKFLTKNFKSLILSAQGKSMKEQKLQIEKTFDNWKGENEQVDDVLILGLKV